MKNKAFITLLMAIISTTIAAKANRGATDMRREVDRFCSDKELKVCATHYNTAIYSWYFKFLYEVSDTTIHTDTTFTLLEECGCPAVLAEQCFITSPEDVDAFGDEDGRQAAAQIYYDAICEWYDSYGPDAAGTDSSTADSLT